MKAGNCKFCNRLGWISEETNQCSICEFEEGTTDRVFAVQDQHRLDRQTNTWKPIFNLQPAEKYGTISFLLEAHEVPFAHPQMVPRIEAELADFNDSDWLLLIGNPSLIGVTVAAAAFANEGRIQLLQWDGKFRKYIPVFVKLSLPT